LSADKKTRLVATTCEKTQAVVVGERTHGEATEKKNNPLSGNFKEKICGFQINLASHSEN